MLVLKNANLPSLVYMRPKVILMATRPSELSPWSSDKDTWQNLGRKKKISEHSRTVGEMGDSQQKKSIWGLKLPITARSRPEGQGRETVTSAEFSTWYFVHSDEASLWRELHAHLLCCLDPRTLRTFLAEYSQGGASTFLPTCWKFAWLKRAYWKVCGYLKLQLSKWNSRGSGLMDSRLCIAWTRPSQVDPCSLEV
jgi:hypothetical protein